MEDRGLHHGTAQSGGPVSDETMNRREALKAFSIVGMAGALDLGVPQLERAMNAMESMQGQQGAFVPKFFTAQEWRTLRILVDYIIPRDARSGSATDAKVPEFMDWILADREATENTKTAVRGGLNWLDRESRDRFNTTFIGAADAQRRQILDDIAYPAKAPPGMGQGVAFFTRMRDFTASGFFSSQMGWKDLGYIGNMSHRWDGCPPEVLEKLGVSYDLMNSKAGQ
jgi:hypothetical protein